MVERMTLLAIGEGEAYGGGGLIFLVAAWMFIAFAKDWIVDTWRGEKHERERERKTKQRRLP